MRKSKGITMVALVVTIVVLLILAGVTLSYVVGKNGVLTNAQNARTETNESRIKTALNTAFTSIIGDQINYGENEENPDGVLQYINEDNLQKALPSYSNFEIEEEEAGEKAIIKFKDDNKKSYEVTVDKFLVISNVEAV